MLRCISINTGIGGLVKELGFNIRAYHENNAHERTILQARINSGHMQKAPVYDTLAFDPPEADIITCGIQNMDILPFIDKVRTHFVFLQDRKQLIHNQQKWKKIFVFNPGEEEFLIDKIV